jgi:Bacteriophage head to tail connecting protein
MSSPLPPGNNFTPQIAPALERNLAAERIYRRYAKAKAQRQDWEGYWQDCYDFALPLRQFSSATQSGSANARRGERLYDATAPDAVEQLAASLLSQLTPPWSRWFSLIPGPKVTDFERARLAPILENATTTLLGHFDRSNFTVELHQALLDLVVAGTGCLAFEEAAPGLVSAFRFKAVPLRDIAFEEGPQGALNILYRESSLSLEGWRERFPLLPPPADLLAMEAKQNRMGAGQNSHLSEEQGDKVQILETLSPQDTIYRYQLFLLPPAKNAGASTPFEDPCLIDQRLTASPFIAFRWIKAPGETYGRSPVMKALPDIKTANKVVELALKNASIAVTGIWQADDDGVLNPSSIKLVPGTIIPKAVGSAGLQPLQPPGRFDVSQLMLEDLRGRIRKALLVDQLGQINGPRMTATEVLERAAEMARLLGATYGRLQSELLLPLLQRGVAILQRRGEIADFDIDGQRIELSYRSPLAQAQGQRDAQNTLRWIEALGALGPEALAAMDIPATARWLGRAFGVPSELLREEDPLSAMASAPSVPLAADPGVSFSQPLMPYPLSDPPTAMVAEGAPSLGAPPLEPLRG